MPRFRTNSPSSVGADLRVCPMEDGGRTHRFAPTCSTKAFSLLEIVSVIAIIGILGGTIAPLAVQQLTSKRGEVTVDRLEEFKKAVIGNPFVIGDDVRSSFGYLGDMGNLPTSLQDLYIKGAQPTYSYDSNKKTGAGWRGPYVNPAIIEDLATLGLDAYMQQLVYSTTAFTDTPYTGASVVGSLTSTGPNRTQGGAVADDRNVYIFRSESFSTVSGFVRDTQGNRLGGALVTMNYPSNGSLTQISTTTGDGVTVKCDSTVWPPGYFNFSCSTGNPPNIPYGNRSITIEPKLVYAPGSYRVGDFYGTKTGPPSNPVPPETPPDGITDDVIIYVTNRSSSPITIKAIKVYFDVNAKGGQPNYDELFFAGPTDIYAAKETGGGQSGSAAKFTGTAPTIGGSGSTSAQNYVVRVQSPQTHLPDLRIGDYPVGESARLVMTGFKSGSNFLNMSGVQFKVEFYTTWSGMSGTLNSTIYFP